MARRGFDYQTWGSGIVLGFVLGCAATVIYLQVGGCLPVTLRLLINQLEQGLAFLHVAPDEGA